MAMAQILKLHMEGLPAHGVRPSGPEQLSGRREEPVAVCAGQVREDETQTTGYLLQRKDHRPAGWRQVRLKWDLNVRVNAERSLRGVPWGRLRVSPSSHVDEGTTGPVLVPVHGVALVLEEWSLAVGPQYSSLGTQPTLCASIPGLVPKQLRFCRNYVEIMPSVAEGVKISIQECQHQFRGRRWNCTTVNNSLAIFGPVLDKATRESAFVHAIAAAGVAFAVTRACAEGAAAICGCSGRQQGSPGEGWKWGGCSEDIEFGGMVSREFADARENRPDARSAMNRHNNEAGRQAIASHMHLKCKCHGLSGSCEVKTCWWSQPDFRAIGDFLKDKYDSASEMVVEKHRESRGWVETLRPRYTYFKVPTERDLVYYEASPNFCEPNPETGSFGTRDRTCNVSSPGIDGCDLLCCGRGHNARTERRREKCRCVFHWCCYVSCQECARVYDVHTCK
ncbi:PREDICTED: protein Wnt-3a [Ceratotherium simum simum]|uniref:Protein Wnt n=1 Tax=Ceratotherium simum simum TaxID=73337 RepID=A0ABM1DDK8_CERSS|nr:PREDICTED: protein Wnt-3a [Ceratotherium simum simum]